VDLGLDRLTRVRSELTRSLGSAKIECVACGHRCKLAPGKRGVCQVRFRDGDGLRVPWGYAAGVAVDPIEKKPFFHVRPGSGALSFGMLGCDFHCAFCQNWDSSQVLRDPAARGRFQPVTVDDLVAGAIRTSSQSLISTYNEPLITAEWAHDVFAAARARGLLTGFVSNGHGTPEVLDYLRPVLDLYKVDLKAFRDAAYRDLGGHLQPVQDTIRGLKERGVWVEVVTLVVPGLNDDPQELRDMAAFLAGVSPSIPWHLTAFHPDYRLADRGRTPAATLARAREIGLEAGLRFVYTGNRPGVAPHSEDTLCPGCGTLLVERIGFMVTTSRLAGRGRCPQCGIEVPGVW
jgi:pyruvate formate lyase activating enzyme